MEVTNTAREAFRAWRAAVEDDWFADDPLLGAALRHHGRPDDPALAAFGRTMARRVDSLVRENNRDEHLPVLRRWDGQGNRIEAVDHHPTYAESGRLAWASDVMGLYREPGRELDSLARVYLFAQVGEGGHACPMACTAGLAKVLRHVGNPRPDWLDRLTDPDFDRAFRGAQFLTEVQGGSDVGANAVVAQELPDGSARIHGEKWFCSVIDADLFLMTARPDGARPGTAGLRAYVVPRRLEDGTTNRFFVRRLKYKLGTRSMASAEVDFEGAWALPLCDFRTVLEQVIDTSRVYNAVCSTAMMRRAVREAAAYARHRTAFGQPIGAFPSVARIVARMHAETLGATALTFHLAAMGDAFATRGGSEADRAAHRMLVNANKYWTSVRGTATVKDAIELLGGNGAIEEFSVLPRLLRDSIVCEAWEGGHNLLNAQILRDAQRLRLHAPTFAHLRALGAPADALARVEARFERLLAGDAVFAAAHVRDVMDELRPLAWAGALAAVHADRPDPRFGAAIEELARSGARGWDPLEDDGLAARTATLAG
jgi:acyl-CoA dehydrogenase